MPQTPSFRLSSSLFAAAIAVSACGGSDGPQLADLSDVAQSVVTVDACESPSGDQVTIYSGRTENLIAPILDAFECESGHEVEVRYASAADLALLIAEEGDATLADVFLSNSPGPVGFLAGQDLLGAIEQSTLDLVDSVYQGSESDWVGFSGRKRVLVHNLDAVAADELPASIFDLTEPIYENRVALPATNGSFEDWFTVFRDVEGTDVATKWLDDMVANGAGFYANNRAIVEAVGRGEIDMGLVNHYYNYQEAAAIGDEHRAANHNFDDDDIGSLLIITGATITAASDDAAIANELIAFMLSESAQRYFTNETFEYPLAAGVAPADILPPLSALEIGSVDFDTIGSGFAETTEIIAASGIVNEG